MSTPPVLASPTATRDLHHLALPPPQDNDLPAALRPDTSALPGGRRPASLPDPHRALQSPLRHHRRTPSVGRKPIKETLDAELSYEDEEDGGQGLRVNQYNLKHEIGRGSFGAVHLAVDQDGNQYAVKEFSKSRLRKRSQSSLLRRPRPSPTSGPRGGRNGLLSTPQGYHKRSASDIHAERAAKDPLYLIREEIAILKKLDHENVVSLIEVLDDPEGDSIYMVMEWCEKGVVMKVGLDEPTEPYPEEQCRLWSRDMILGIEYLHAQGIVHRDIKPDNLLLSSNDVLKLADFGVSEMFAKGSPTAPQKPMLTSKTSGSPAFLPPELCYAGHGDVDGVAADIWSMGVSLYCLVFGRLPFNHSGVMELYEAIKHDAPELPLGVNPQLHDLFDRILDKDPTKRIVMSELREHPWVTNSGSDPLLPASENTANLIETTENDVADAISSSIRNVMTVVRAVRRFKARLLQRAADRTAKKASERARIEGLKLESSDQEERRARSCDVTGEKVVEGLGTLSLHELKETGKEALQHHIDAAAGAIHSNPYLPHPHLTHRSSSGESGEEDLNIQGEVKEEHLSGQGKVVERKDLLRARQAHQRTPSIEIEVVPDKESAMGTINGSGEVLGSG